LRRTSSKTAEQVALAALLAAHGPRFAGLAPQGFVELTERLLLASGRVPKRRLAALRRPGYRRFVGFLERLTFPGQWLHLLLRKRFVEDEVEAAIAAGAEQLLMVGAGFDTLALRLAPRYPAIRFVELDHPGTQAVKRRALVGFDLPANVELVAADLANTTLGTAVAGTRLWHESAPSIVVAEGLLMYLTESDVAAFLDAVGRIVAPGSRLLLTYVHQRADGRFDFGRVTGLATLLHRMSGEPFLWGVRDGELEPFLAAHDLTVEGPPERYDLRRRYLVPAGIGDDVLLARIERLAVARLGDGRTAT